MALYEEMSDSPSSLLWNLDSLYPGRVFVLLQIAEAAEDVCAFKEART